MTYNIKNLLVLVSLTFVFSCHKEPRQLGDFALLPTPSEYNYLGVSGLGYHSVNYFYIDKDVQFALKSNLLNNLKKTEEIKKAQVIGTIDQSLDVKPEGYTLVVSDKNVTITGKDQAGLFYGLATLEQLLEDAKEQEVNLPLCRIEDFPELAYRSVHLDIKHHTEKLDYYYTLLDKLSSYKVNAIIVELEDKIKYIKHPKIASADAFSIEEWQKLSNYAKERNIEISPLVQGLGHVSFILKHEAYKELRDDPESDWAFNPLDPRTYQLQFDLYDEAMKATPHGKYLHIGGDEVETTGRGTDKSPLELQLLWLNKVSQYASDHGRIPIFWDDMPLRHAGVYGAMFNPDLNQAQVDSIWNENEHKLLKSLDQFPKNCIYMRWNYWAPQALGNVKAMQWFTDNGLQAMGATAGQTRWCLMPQNESNISNIKSFAEGSIKSNLNGLLLTLWDDDSPHFELYTRGILAFAEYTWAGNKTSIEKLKSNYRQREYAHALVDSSFAFIDQLETPVAFWKNALLNGNNRNYLQGMKYPINNAVIDLPNKDNLGVWHTKHKERLERAAKLLQQSDTIANRIAVMKSKAKRNAYNLEIYEQVNKLSRFPLKALLALQTYDSAKSENEKLKAIAVLNNLNSDFEALRKEFQSVYSKTRILTKPADYILDQDHHVHLANQSLSFDWQFKAELLFLEKLNNNVLRDIPALKK